MEFIFGTVMYATMLVDPSLHAYQAAFYRNFEWGGLTNALKWNHMERTRVTLCHFHFSYEGVALNNKYMFLCKVRAVY